MNTQSQNFSGNLNRNSIIFQWILGIQRASFSGHDSLGKISSFCQNGATRKRLFQDRLRNTKGGRCFLQKGWYPLNMQQDATRCEKPTVCSSCSERETMGFCTFLACLPQGNIFWSKASLGHRHSNIGFPGQPCQISLVSLPEMGPPLKQIHWCKPWEMDGHGRLSGGFVGHKTTWRNMLSSSSSSPSIYILYILELTKLFYNTSVGVHLWRRSSTLASIPPWMRPPQSC